MARLNRETFGRRGPTNVISFPLEEQLRGGRGHPGSKNSRTPAPPPMLGEVVISVETTVRQAREAGWPWQELLDFYLIHGILHLLGYDHEDQAAAAQMDARAWELMGLLHPRLKSEQ